MASSVLKRAAVRGGYGALMRGNVAGISRRTARAFTAASQLQGKLYAESHEWVEYSADKKTATIGVSEFAAKSLGDVVYVELPDEGLEVRAKESFGCVESVKSASDVYAPVAGKIIETNQTLEEKPSLINQDAEGEGWLAKIEVTGETPESLMDAAKYKAFTEEDSDVN